MRNYYMATSAVDDNGRVIHVECSDDVDGLSPDVLAEPGVEVISAEDPAVAAYHYARKHGVTGALVSVNTSDAYELWAMLGDELFPIDTGRMTIWEAEDEPDR